jgi:hypothetical protein
MLTGVALLLAACGGGGDEQDAEALLDRAFSRTVPSANVEIDAELEVEGLPGFDDPISINAAGPYVNSDKTLPKLDMDVDIAAQAGEAIQLGLLSTGRRVFVKFGGSYFEQPPAQIAQANRRLARDRKGGGSLSELGLDPRSWVVDASVAGEEEIDGTTTEHVKGELDVEAVVTDLNDLVKQSAGAVSGSGQTPQQLDRRGIERLASSVTDPTFDVYVGKDDGILRRVSLRLDLTVPEDDQADVNGVTGASIKFAAELSDIGGDQQVKAPRTSSPISVLTSQLGGLGGLAEGLTGGSGTTAAPNTDGAPAPEGAEDYFDRYGKCLDQTSPDDRDAIARCAQLVN